MKQLLLFSFFTLLIFTSSQEAHASFFVKHTKANVEVLDRATQLQSSPAFAATMENLHFRDMSSVSDMLPRGRGNGKQAMSAFFFGFFAIVPFLALVLAPFAYYKGIRNMNKKRKGHGFAIAAIVLASLGIAFTILLIAIS